MISAACDCRAAALPCDAGLSLLSRVRHLTLSLTYHLPPARLLPYVAGGYVIRSPEPLVHSEVSSLLGQLHWQLRGRVEYDDEAGRFRQVPRSAVIGSTTRSPDVRFHGPFTMVGVGLLPAGWRRWVGAPASECLDLIAPMDVYNPPAALLGDRLDPDSADETLAAAMYAELERSFPDSIDRERQIFLIDRWLVQDARNIQSLMDEFAVSHRQLNRIALETHGAPLRLLSTKFRTLRCAARLASGAAHNWSEAMTNEFCDQPHLIRSFRRFVGTTPTVFLRDEGSFNREIMRKRLIIRPDNPLAAWG